VVNPEPVSYQEGRVDTFWVVDLVDREVHQVDAVLSEVSEHAYWYFQIGSEPSRAALEEASEAFEGNIYPTVTGGLGTEWTPGVDNDTHITILHTLLQGAAGYYSASDEYPRGVYPISNEREMVYMNTRNLPLGSSSYLGTLAHELQHAVHWAGDPTEETWVSEGLSEVAKGLAGYDFGFIDYFLSSPATSLTGWPSDGQSSLPHYGAATLFMEYLAQRYGSHDNLKKLVERPEDGVEGVTAYLRAIGYQETFEDVFKKWLVANYLDPTETDGYYYDGLDVAISPSKTIHGYGVERGTVPQYAGEYVEVQMEEGSARVYFQGQAETPLLPTTPHSGDHCWWGNRGDGIDSTLTAEFDLSGVSQATLEFWAWYAIEESWDYAYVEVSTDGGKTWDILEGEYATPENPVGSSFGPGYTGESGGWLEESVDMTPYAGTKVLLRFEYVTDDAVNEDGICIDDISIPEIGYSDDAEDGGEWDAQGFIRTDNRMAQRYLVQVIEVGEDTVVRDIPLNQDGEGSLMIGGFGAGLERAVVVIAPVASKTTEAASYVLSVEPVPG
jgi:immune inhibitor A